MTEQVQGSDPSDLSPEVPAEDALEQSQPAAAPEDDDLPAELPVEADPTDRAEQGRTVVLDDDDYR